MKDGRHIVVDHARIDFAVRLHEFCDDSRCLHGGDTSPLGLRWQARAFADVLNGRNAVADLCRESVGSA